MTALCLLLLCAAPPPADAKPKTPPASDMAILYFLAGDMRKAVDTARAGIKTDAARCKALYPMLVEYQFLVPRRDTLTLEEAKAFLAWDKKISPQASSKLTAPVVGKYVDLPLRNARTAKAGADLVKARKMLSDVLAVDPANADALALKASIDQPDGGK